MRSSDEDASLPAVSARVNDGAGCPRRRAFSDAGIHSGWGYLVVALVGDAGALAGMAAWVRMDWARVPEPAVLSPPAGPGAPPAPSSPPCPRCGRPTEFAVRFGRYWCPVDRAYV